MESDKRKLRDLLPYETPQPADPKWRPWARAARIVAYVVLLGAIITSVVQYQVATVRDKWLLRLPARPEIPKTSATVSSAPPAD